ncbi:MAG TPA: hypothetical protein VK994_07365 [Bacteroidales bacterium]|nr:hypothetical protein [Bacteroidales bacterium]
MFKDLQLANKFLFLYKFNGLSSLMDQAKELVSRINEQVLELLGRHRSLRSECSDLKSKNAELQASVESHKIEIEKLKEQIVKLKIAKSLLDKKDSTEVKTKIEKMLREIDKCVGLLNQ